MQAQAFWMTDIRLTPHVLGFESFLYHSLTCRNSKVVELSVSLEHGEPLSTACNHGDSKVLALK